MKQKRRLLLPLTAKERDYLIRVLREQQADWLRAADFRRLSPHPNRSREDHVDYVLDAESRASVADAMAIRLYGLRSVSDKG